MRFLSLTGSVLLACLSSFAFPITANDPYVANPGASDVAPLNSDVIGLYKSFDIKSLSLTLPSPAELQVALSFNHSTSAAPNGDTNLSNPVRIGGGFPNLYTGDVLFNVGGNWKWAIPLTTHPGASSGFDPGDVGSLFRIQGAFTADEVLNDVPGIYRYTYAVWADPAGRQRAGNGSVSALKDPGFAYLINVSVNVTASDQALWGEFLNDMYGGGTVSFASQACGNDVIEVRNPEPLSMLLIGSGLVALGLLRRRITAR